MTNSMPHEVYLDYNATTPCDPRVVETMLPYFSEFYANPSSSHRLGRRVYDATQRARTEVAEFIGASPGEIMFREQRNRKYQPCHPRFRGTPFRQVQSAPHFHNTAGAQSRS